ncbi:MAG: FAD-dependent thymidylate synthase [Chloroflexota bacterium]
MTLVPSEHERRVYCLTGIAPEVQAYAMARYSRSRQSMMESVQELNAQRAEQFLNTFYFQYGHRSIADLAHLAMAVENISILAAVRVVDEQLWDGQERSTRYQDFRRTTYVIPPGIRGSSLEPRYVNAADSLFASYESLSEDLLQLLLDSATPPASMDGAQVRRTLRARAFDVARYLLPLATRTSVGQVVSARVLERQISRLLSDPLLELREIGADLRHAAEESSATLDGLATGPSAAPTLVKYTAPIPYLSETRLALASTASEVLQGIQPERNPTTVALTMEQPLLDETVATLLYEHDPVGRSYQQISAVVSDLSEQRKQAILHLSVVHRGRHDELLRAHQSGHALKFDLLMDFGSFRDLHRHRRCVQIIQGPRSEHGFDDVREIFRLGLGEVGEAAEGLQQRFRQAIYEASDAALTMRAELTTLTDTPNDSAQYLLPLAVRTRALFKMELAEAAYIIEQRTQPAGHFSYRHVAWGMYQELRLQAPTLAALVRPVDPTEVVDLFRR